MHALEPFDAGSLGRLHGCSRRVNETRSLGSNRFPNSMRRGDVVTVAAAGDYGKPRPAVVVQSDAFPESHASVIVCQMTSDLVDAPNFRITVEPSPGNGLRARSQVIADKPVTIRRERIGRSIGHLTPQDLIRLNAALAFVMGLAD
jgi:mRNA interferase MazF